MMIELKFSQHNSQIELKDHQKQMVLCGLKSESYPIMYFVLDVHFKDASGKDISDTIVFSIHKTYSTSKITEAEFEIPFDYLEWNIVVIKARFITPPEKDQEVVLLARLG